MSTSPASTPSATANKQPEFPQAEITHAEWQQAERAGIDPADAQGADHRPLSAHATTGRRSRPPLRSTGYVLAKGDRRDYVLVDPTAKSTAWPPDQGRRGQGSTRLHGRRRPGNPAECRPGKTLQQDAAQKQQPEAKEQPLTQERLQPPAPEEDEYHRPAREEIEAVEPTPTATAEEDQYHRLSREEIEALEQTLAERHATETRRLTEAQQAELAHLRGIIDRENAGETRRHGRPAGRRARPAAARFAGAHRLLRIHRGHPRALQSGSRRRAQGGA